MVLTLDVGSIPYVSVELGEIPTFSVSVGDIEINSMLPEYEGALEVTPSEERQVLPTAAKSVYEDIVIEAIPNNYGLITWDGSVLTVS